MSESPSSRSAPTVVQTGLVAQLAALLDGSFSAEHGVGKLKPYMMPEWRGGAELATMRRIKAALDPAGLMNPGKLLP